MAIENTDFVLYNNIAASTGLSSTAINAINNIGANGGSQGVSGFGNGDELILNFNPGEFNIPNGATIVGFKARIRASKVSSAQEAVTVNVDISDSITAFSNNYFSSDNLLPQGNTFPIDNSPTNVLNYEVGFGTTNQNNFIGTDTISLFEGDVLRLRLQFIQEEEAGNATISFNSNLVSIGLRAFYEAPTPTKVKLESGPSTIATKSLRSSEAVNTTFSVGSNANRLTTTNTPGTVTLNNNAQNVFTGGVIGVRFNQVEDLNGSTFNLSDVWNSVTNIRTRFIYSWNSSLADNSNNFKIGWTGEANSSDTTSLYNIVYNEETIFNTEDNHDILKLYTSNINGATLANLKQNAAGDLTKLRFIFRYNDDSPDNAVILYGQGSDGGAVPAGNSLENQASLEFRITYNTTPINYKVKIQGSHTKIKIQPVSSN